MKRRVAAARPWKECGFPCFWAPANVCVSWENVRKMHGFNRLRASSPALHQLLADAATMVAQLARASRQRAADWEATLRTVRGNGRGATPTATRRSPARPKARKPTTKSRPARAKTKAKKR